MAPSAPPKAPTSELKHLNFIVSGGASAAKAAEVLLSQAKAYGSARLGSDKVAALESTIHPYVSYSAPYTTKALDMSASLLKLADDKVDQVVVTATSRHGENMKTFTAAKNHYFDLMSSTADYVARQPTVVLSGVQAARDALLATVAKAREMADPDIAIATAWDAWTRFSSYPAVAKILEKTEPATTAGLQTFTKLHDSLVASPTYKNVIDGASSYAIKTTTYKLSAKYLYPMVRPVAESKAAGTFYDYWKPAAVAAAH